MAEFGEVPGWPKAVGITSIVVASLGLLCNTCGMLGQVVSKMMISMAPPEQQAEIEKRQFHAMDPVPAEYALMGIRWLLACWLLVAGIMLVRRAAGARPMHLIYAVASIGLSAAGVVVFAMKYPHVLTELEKAKDNPAAKFMTPARIIGITVFMTLILTIWPTFCLIWFGLVKRDGRDLTGVPRAEDPLSPA